MARGVSRSSHLTLVTVSCKFGIEAKRLDFQPVLMRALVTGISLKWSETVNDVFPYVGNPERADLLGERLVGGATETARVFMEELGERFSTGLRNSNSTPQFIIEVIVFYMHLVDRLAFAHLGFMKREQFMDRLIVAVVKEVLRGLSRELSADDFGTMLRDTYNRRQTEYTKY